MPEAPPTGLLIALLACSLTVRVAALVWSAALLRRTRDWRLGALTILLAAMALRQSVSLASLVYDGGEHWPIITLYGSEFPGLGISILCLGLVFFLGRSLEERRRQARVLEESEERYRKVFEEGPLAMGMSDMHGRILKVNPAFCRMLGYSAAELTGRTIFQITHPEDVDENQRQFGDMKAGIIGSYRYQKRFVRRDGSAVWVNMTVSLVRDAAGQPLYTLGMAEDITERRAVEQRQQLMMNELDHRVKNNLATVVALAEQTLGRSQDIEQFRRAFIGRLHAMARAHEALAHCRWQGVDLRDIAALILRPHQAQGVDAERVVLSGDPLMLPAEAALPVSLALHELATNAVKHGSLSEPQGRVSLSWRVMDTHQLRLVWEEDGGPRATPPKRHGMGHELIDGLIGYQLRGTVEMAFPSTGFRCTLSLPLNGHQANVVTQPAAGAAR